MPEINKVYLNTRNFGTGLKDYLTVDYEAHNYDFKHSYLTQISQSIEYFN